MKRIVENYIKRLSESVIRDIIKEDIDKVTVALPVFKHTDRAFLPGDKVYIERRMEGKAIYPSYLIKAVNGNELVLEERTTVTDPKTGITYPSTNEITTTTQIQAICTTDTWLKVFNTYNQDGERGILPASVIFDYEDVDGETYVTMRIRVTASFSDSFKVGCKYDDVKNGRQLTFKKFEVESEMDKVAYYCKEGEVTPFKSKVAQDTAVQINPSWIVQEAHGRFRGWSYGKRSAIVEKCPWLRDMVAKWCDSKGTIRNIAISKYL